jgi:hypothetical protein
VPYEEGIVHLSFIFIVMRNTLNGINSNLDSSERLMKLAVVDKTATATKGKCLETFF